MPPEPQVRSARRADAPHLAAFVDLASEGLARRIWAAVAEPGEDLLAVGIRRAERDDADFSWRNALMAELDGAVAGGVVGYRLDAPDGPDDDMPPLARPLVALERIAAGTWYVNVLATYPEMRRRGVAGALLAASVRRAGGEPLSLIVGDGNTAARAVYARHGFVERARRPVAGDGDWRGGSRDWVLMLREGG